MLVSASAIDHFTLWQGRPCGKRVRRLGSLYPHAHLHYLYPQLHCLPSLLLVMVRLADCHFAP